MTIKPKSTLKMTPEIEVNDEVIETPSTSQVDDYSAMIGYHRNVVDGLQLVVKFLQSDVDYMSKLIDEEAPDSNVVLLQKRCDCLKSYIAGLEGVARFHAVEADFVQEQLDNLLSLTSDVNN